MTYSTLLLPLDDDARADVRADHAIALARRFDARLVGLSCHRPSLPAGPDPLSQELELHRLRAREREQAFARRCDAARFGAFAVEVSEDEASRAILHHANAADLVVLGQPDPADPRCMARREVVDNVVLRNPRPTLVIPFAGHFENLGRTILAAWDGSHGAARALADALPLMARSNAVQVVQLDAFAKTGDRIDPDVLTPVLRWLASHRVASSGSVRHARGGGIGESLLSLAADVGADTLVMGGWGHARWAERLLGGATLTVLESMTLPVLISH